MYKVLCTDDRLAASRVTLAGGIVEGGKQGRATREESGRSASSTYKIMAIMVDPDAGRVSVTVHIQIPISNMQCNA